MADNPQEFRFFLNAIAFSIILFVIFLRRSMKERERQRELASKWKTLNDKIKAARSILIMRQLAKKKRYQRERKRPKLSKVQSVSSSMRIPCFNQPCLVRAWQSSRDHHAGVMIFSIQYLDQAHFFIYLKMFFRWNHWEKDSEQLNWRQL